MDFNTLFEYRDGKLFRKVRTSRTVRVGDRAGCLNKHRGYRVVSVNGIQLSEHRVIWEMHNGPIPEDMYIDHINHIRDDNRIENLRLVTRLDNQKNQSQSKRNTSGYTGVHLCKKTGRWFARIMVNGNTLHLGRYDTKEAAATARAAANKLHNYHPNHGVSLG